MDRQGSPMKAPAAARLDSGGLHYAWVILAGSVLIELFGLGFGIFAITTVYPFIIKTFPDWSRTLVFVPTTAVILTVMALSPLMGWLVDRFSIRRLFVIGILIQMAALYLFSRTETPFGYVGSSVLLGVGMSAVTILPNQVLVSRWFHQRVGMVNGVILAATALGASMAPPLITRIIEASDWRTAFVWMALAAGTLPMLVVFLVVRDRPEEMGLEPYGVKDDHQERAADRAADVRVRDAVGTPLFWIFGAAVFFAGMPCYSYNKHILVQLGELGYSPVQAADYKGLFFFVAAMARLSFGWLCDRYDRRAMFLTHVLFIAAGYPLLLFVDRYPGLLVPCLVIIGIGYGGLLPAVPILSTYYFGRTHLGKILGWYKLSYDLAAAGAPQFTAYLWERYHGYWVPDLWLTVFAWIGVMMVLLLPSQSQRRSVVAFGRATAPP
jgi:MFS family permease